MGSARRRTAVVLTAGAMFFAGCSSARASAGDAVDDRPTVVVTTNILGDVVENLLDGQARVVTIMPVGTDPHRFQASARQVVQIGAADGIIANGAGFEGGLEDILASAESDGVPVLDVIDSVQTIDIGASGHGVSDHEDGDHDEVDDGYDDDGHDDDGHGGGEVTGAITNTRESIRTSSPIRFAWQARSTTSLPF